MDALAVHVVDSIAATATDTNHFNDTVFLIRLAEIEDCRPLAVCIVVVWHISFQSKRLLFFFVGFCHLLDKGLEFINKFVCRCRCLGCIVSLIGIIGLAIVNVG